jgi:hypothetical protein
MVCISGKCVLGGRTLTPTQRHAHGVPPDTQAGVEPRGLSPFAARFGVYGLFRLWPQLTGRPFSMYIVNRNQEQWHFREMMTNKANVQLGEVA